MSKVHITTLPFIFIFISSLPRHWRSDLVVDWQVESGVTLSKAEIEALKSDAKNAIQDTLNR
jgi:hypothetical protein